MWKLSDVKSKRGQYSYRLLCFLCKLANKPSMQYFHANNMCCCCCFFTSVRQLAGQELVTLQPVLAFVSYDLVMLRHQSVGENKGIARRCFTRSDYDQFLQFSGFQSVVREPLAVLVDQQQQYFLSPQRLLSPTFVSVSLACNIKSLSDAIFVI